MMDQREYGAGFAEMQRQAKIAYSKPDDGLGLELPTVGSVRVYEGDDALLVFAGDRRVGMDVDESFPAMLDASRVEELRDYLSAWLASRR